jgi:hypothetical protein
MQLDRHKGLDIRDADANASIIMLNFISREDPERNPVQKQVLGSSYLRIVSSVVKLSAGPKATNKSPRVSFTYRSGGIGSHPEQTCNLPLSHSVLDCDLFMVFNPHQGDSVVYLLRSRDRRLVREVWCAPPPRLEEGEPEGNLGGVS